MQFIVLEDFPCVQFTFLEDAFENCLLHWSSVLCGTSFLWSNHCCQLASTAWKLSSFLCEVSSFLVRLACLCLKNPFNWQRENLFSSQLFSVFFNSCSFYTIVSLKKFSLLLLSEYLFSMLNISWFSFFFLHRIKFIWLLYVRCARGYRQPLGETSQWLHRVWFRLHHKLDRPVTA